MREINISETSNVNTLLAESLILQGENLATKINVTIPSDMLGYSYTMSFQLNDEVVVVTPELTPDENNIISYTLTNALTNSVGYLNIQINAYEDTTLIKSSKYTFKVKESIDGSGEVIPESYVPWYTALHNEIYNAIDTFSDEEVIRVSNENVRISSEDARELSEIAREESEVIRVSNEDIRIQNELDRQNDFIDLTDGNETALHKHTAFNINVVDSGNYFTGTQVESALQEVGANLGTVETQLADKANQSALEVEKARITNLATLAAGSTTGDAELIDLRVGTNGAIYANSGEAIRTQFQKIEDSVFETTTNTYEGNEIVKPEYEIGGTGNVYSNPGTTWSVYDKFIPVIGSATYYYNLDGYDYSTITGDGNNTSDVFLAYYDANYAYISKLRANSPRDYPCTVKTISFSGEASRYVKDFTVPINAAYCKIQLKTVALNYKIELSKSTDFSFEYVPYRVNIVESRIDETIAYIDTETGKSATAIIGTAFSVVGFGSQKTPVDDLAIALNGLQYDADVNIHRTKIAYTANKISHDSTLQIDSNGIGYCVAVGNDVDMGDSPGSQNAYVFLGIVDLKTSPLTNAIVTRHIIAKYGDAIGAFTITSGVGLPNCVLKDGILHIIFSAQLSDGKWYLFKQEYDTVNTTFSSTVKCNFVINSTSYVFNTDNINSHISALTDLNSGISMNAQISYNSIDGYYYCGVCVCSQLINSIIMRTIDFTNFEFWLEPTFANESHANFEGSCLCKDGYLYYALRQDAGVDYSNNKMILSKFNISSKALVDEAIIIDAISRACWVAVGSTIYLAHSIHNRQRVEFIRINTAKLANSTIVLQGSSQGLYPSIMQYDGKLFMASTGASGTTIYARRFNAIEPYNYTYAANKLAGKFGVAASV